MAKNDPRNPAASADQALEQELNGLKQEFARLQTEKAKTEANLETAAEQLKRLQDQAQREYGTADLAELEAELASRRETNARLVEDYRAHIQAVRNELAEVEQASGQNGREPRA